MPLDDIFIYIQQKFKKSYAFYPGLIKPLDGINSEITGKKSNYSSQFDYIYPELVKKGEQLTNPWWNIENTLIFETPIGSEGGCDVILGGYPNTFWVTLRASLASIHVSEQRKD